MLCRGYLAPEYATLGQVSEKIDVFSYGVLVLEVVSGRRNIDLRYPEGKAYLAEWVSFHCNYNCSLSCAKGVMLQVSEMYCSGYSDTT